MTGLARFTGLAQLSETTLGLQLYGLILCPHKNCVGAIFRYFSAQFARMKQLHGKFHPGKLG